MTNMNRELGQRETVALALAGAPVPRVGDGATEFCWSDRKAYTVIEVVSPTCVKVQRDAVTCLSCEQQAYLYALDPSAAVEVLVRKRTKRYPEGRWVRKTDGVRGNEFEIGIRREYRDPSF